MPARRSGYLVALAVAVPILALFGPLLMTDRLPAMRDAGHYYYPLFYWTSSEWAAGRVPLWNPHENCGTSIIADPTSSLFYPGQLLFALPVDFALRYKLYLIGHVILAAATSFLLARHWQASHAAAGLAALAYACGGSVAFQHCNVVYLVGAAWLPLALLFVDQVLRQGNWRAAAGLGVVLALLILGGDPQAAYHVLLAAVIYAVVLAVRRDTNPKGERGISLTQARSASEGTPQTHPRLHFGIVWLGTAVGVAFLLAAVQILPSAEASRTSVRAMFDEPRNIYEVASTGRGSVAIFGTPPPGTHHAVAYDFSVGPWRLLEFVWPNIGGRMFPTHRRWFSLVPAEGRIWTPSLYLGLFPLVLGVSVFGLLRGGDERTRWLSWLALIFTLGSFGWYGLGWLAREIYVGLAEGEAESVPIGSPVGGIYWLFVTLLPKYVYFRYPAKLFVVASLAISQLAAIGWDRAWAELPKKLIRVLWGLGSASGLVVACAFVVSCFVTIGGGAVDPTFGPFDSRGAWTDIVSALAHTSIVSLGSAWLLRHANTQNASRWQLAALLLAAVELAAANYWLVPTASAELWRTPSRAGETIARIDRGATSPRVLRASGNWRPVELGQRGSPARMTEIVAWERDTLFPKYELLNGLSLVDAYGGVQAADYKILLQVAEQHGPKLADGTVLPHPNVLRLLGTEWLVLPEGCRSDFAEPTSQPNVWRVPDPFPRAWLAEQIDEQRPLKREAGREEQLVHTRQALFPGGQPRDFLRRPVLELSRPGPLIGHGEPADVIESCRIIHDSPLLVRIEVAARHPRTLIVADRYDPGWRATVIPADPRRKAFETGIVRANRVLRAVLVPAGKHTVEFRYLPQSFVCGAWISGVSWGVLAIIGSWFAIRKVRQKRPKS